MLWATNSPKALSRRASEIVAGQRNVIFVSAAFGWVIATKVRLGKLPGTEILERDFLAFMDRAGYTLIPIETATALRAARAAHRDPFDRILAAQALADDLAILSADTKLDTFGITRIW